MSLGARARTRTGDNNIWGDQLTKKLIVAIAVTAIACTAWASTASAKHKHKMAPAPAAQQATTLPGVNPMTNAPPTHAIGIQSRSR